MKLLTRKILAAEAVNNLIVAMLHKELEELGGNPNPDDVDRIIGNNTWTTITCQECDKRVEAAVQIDYELLDVVICQPCLKAALKLMQQK